MIKTKADAVSADRLKSFAARIERLMDERDGIPADIRDIYTEAKSVGYVPKVLRKAITRKRMDAGKRDEEDAILELYEGALDAKTRKAVKMAAEGATARQIEAETGIDHATVARSVALNKKSATVEMGRSAAEHAPKFREVRIGRPHTEQETLAAREVVCVIPDSPDPCPNTCAREGRCAWDGSDLGVPSGRVSPSDEHSTADFEAGNSAHEGEEDGEPGTAPQGASGIRRLDETSARAIPLGAVAEGDSPQRVATDEIDLTPPPRLLEKRREIEARRARA